MKGKDRFIYHLNLLEQLLIDASGRPNPGEWLYRNNARTFTFMLEGLCKIYAHVNDEETFQSLKKHFKQLEDAFGQLDYYECFAEQFEKDTKMDSRIAGWLRGKASSANEQLNALLITDKWISSAGKRIEKIREKLDNVKWPSDDIECVATEKFYHSTISEIFHFYESIAPKFSNIETQAHGLRRRLRWLSIYPHAMLGVIQLKETPVPEEQQEYQTPAILNSKFNRFPEARGACVLLLNKPNFISVSWMIDALGKLKDQGLEQLLIKEASNDLGLPQPDTTLPAILDECSKIAADFFKKNILEDLLAGISS